MPNKFFGPPRLGMPFLLLLVLLTASACAEPLFDRVAEMELPATGKSFGATWADLDRDGRLDFLLGRHGRGVGVYLTRPGLHFSRQDSCAFVPCTDIDQHGTAACDFDADGDWDLYVTVGADRGEGTGPNELWMAGPAGPHRNILAADHLLADAKGRGRGAAWVRLDNDRYPELLVLNYKSPTRLFRYDGMSWGDVSRPVNPYLAEAPARKNPRQGRGLWFSVAAPADWDNDGHTDLFLAGDGYFLMRNLGTGNLADVTVEAGLPLQGRLLVHAVPGDVDNDGDLDLLFVHRWLDGLALWLNESTPGQIRFVAGPDLSHLPLAPELDSALLADLDNDGFLDLYVMMQGREQNNLPNLLARGLGDGNFTGVSDLWGGRGAVEGLPRGAWPLDLDRDGDLDLMLVHGKEDFPDRSGISVLYQNRTINKGLTLELSAHNGIPHGLGARVELHANQTVQTRQVQSVMNHWNATILPLHFGLGQDPGPYRLVVTWPDGERQSTDLQSGVAAFRIRQGEQTAEELQ